LGVSITSTAVVFGIATLGTPDPAPDCDCATDAAGSAAIRKGIMKFIISPLESICFAAICKSTTVLLRIKKIYP